MSAPTPAPTGTAAADLLALELAEETSTAPTGADSVRVEDPWPNEASGLPGSLGEHLLQRAYGSQARAERFYRDQVLDHLTDEMAAFAGRMEMAFVATADSGGETDCSLRTGPPGFLQVLDANRLAYPEYRGNGVMASLGNISENPRVGLLLVDFVTDLIGLHVNGRARIVEDAQLRADHPGLPAEAARGKAPERWVVVEVVEAYIHCRKHIPKLAPAPRERSAPKAGDYFGAKATDSPWTGLTSTATRPR
jgi:predicted pyridoxine 5'-phosphate oxidase superfamily flavin-nucleotide-binding protein